MSCRCGKAAEPGEEHCFLCRVRSVGFTFSGGGGYGRDAFSSRTNGEWLNEHVGDVKEMTKNGEIAPESDYVR